MNSNDTKDAQVANIITAAKFTWGSHQYDETAEWYQVLNFLESKFDRDRVVDLVDIEVGGEVPFEGAVLERFKKALSVDILDPEVVGDDTTEIRKAFEGVSTVTEALHFLRGSAWDLWGGAPYIAQFVFPELITGQSTPHAVGIICWLLKSYKFVENDEPFREWDT